MPLVLLHKNMGEGGNRNIQVTEHFGGAQYLAPGHLGSAQRVCGHLFKV